MLNLIYNRLIDPDVHVSALETQIYAPASKIKIKIKMNSRIGVVEWVLVFCMDEQEDLSNFSVTEAVLSQSIAEY